MSLIPEEELEKSFKIVKQAYAAEGLDGKKKIFIDLDRRTKLEKFLDRVEKLIWEVVRYFCEQNVSKDLFSNPKSYSGLISSGRL